MKQEAGKSYHEAINKVIHYVERNTSQPLYLENLAEIAHLSSFHFHKIFKSITKNTINDFVIRLRLEKAANLLIKSQNAIGDIAAECGYLNQENFSRSFTKQFNLTPTQYRQTDKFKKIKIKETNSPSKLTSYNAIPGIETFQPIHVAYIRHIGIYSEVGLAWAKLLEWKKKHVFEMENRMIGITHDNPEITDVSNIRYDACISVSKEIKPENEIGYKILQGGKYAVFKYDGSQNEVNEIYDYIYGVWLLNNSFEVRDTPSFEIYTNQQTSKNNKRLTEIYIPIK